MAKRMFWMILLLLAGRSIPAAADACTDQCWANYDACVGSGCSSYWQCAQCDEDRDNCLNYCASIPPCPSTRDYTVVTLVSKTSSGRSGCFNDFFSGTGAYTHNEYLEKDKRTTYRETTSCNGTKTTTVLSTTYETYYCWTKNCPTVANCCSNPSSPAGLRACSF